MEWLLRTLPRAVEPGAGEVRDEGRELSPPQPESFSVETYLLEAWGSSRQMARELAQELAEFANWRFGPELPPMARDFVLLMLVQVGRDFLARHPRKQRLNVAELAHSSPPRSTSPIQMDLAFAVVHRELVDYLKKRYRI